MGYVTKKSQPKVFGADGFFRGGSDCDSVRVGREKKGEDGQIASSQRSPKCDKCILS